MLGDNYAKIEAIFELTVTDSNMTQFVIVLLALI